MEENRKKIIIIDDQPENIDTIVAALDNLYETIITTNSKMAINLIYKHLPALILLDIKMPDIDGYEICTRLKGDNKTKDIPIIFLTAKDDSESIVKGFDLGAVDYITKPFNPQEVKARINTHVKLVTTQNELKARNNKLELINLQIQDQKVLNEDKAEYLANRIKKIIASKKSSDSQLNTIKELIPLIATNDLGNLKIVLKVLNESRESLDKLVKDPNEEYFKILSSTIEPLNTAISDIESIIIALVSMGIITEESITNVEVAKTSFHEILEQLYVKGKLSVTHFEEFLELAKFHLKNENDSGIELF